MNEYNHSEDDFSDPFDDGQGAPGAGYGRADELASAWFDDAQEIDPDVSMPASDSRRLADLYFLNALLERLHMQDGRTPEDRIRRVMSAIPTEEADWTDHQVAMPASLERHRRSTAWRWLFSSATAAALVFALFGYWWISTPGQSAYAAVERAYRDAIQPRDREYHVSSEVRITTNHTMSIESQLVVRGGEKFTLRHPVQLGQCWIGSNGQQGWYVPAVGVPRTENDPVIAMQWARKHGVGLPDLHVSALIDFLATSFDLELLPSEKLAGRGDIAWQRVRGVRREAEGDKCHLVELWAHPRTGVAQKIIIEWERQPGELGLMSITLNLVREKQLPDDWYEAASHQPLPILPVPPIVPMLHP